MYFKVSSEQVVYHARMVHEEKTNDHELAQYVIVLYMLYTIYSNTFFFQKASIQTIETLIGACLCLLLLSQPYRPTASIVTFIAPKSLGFVSVGHNFTTYTRGNY